MSKTVLWVIALMGLTVIGLINFTKPTPPPQTVENEGLEPVITESDAPEKPAESILETAKEIIEDVTETVSETANEQVESTIEPATIQAPVKEAETEDPAITESPSESLPSDSSEEGENADSALKTDEAEPDAAPTPQQSMTTPNGGPIDADTYNEPTEIESEDLPQE